MSEKKKETLFSSEEQTSRKAASAFLHELADRVASGKVVLRQGNQEVAVELPDTFELEVTLDRKDKKKGTKRSLEIELNWYEGKAAMDPMTLG